MTVDELRPLLNGWKQTGRGKYMACCPAHNDKNPSLSITETNNGHALLNCFAGCRLEDIADALRVPASELKPSIAAKKGKFQTGFTPKRENKTKPKKDHGKLLRTDFYKYTDIDGNFIRTKQIKRYEDKTKDTTWLNDAKGDPSQYLYNLPCVKNADTVFLVEGEKDVETLKANGRAAVSVPHGAGTKWKDIHTEYLKGKNVIVIQDNDEPGKKLVIKECNALTGQAASVKLVDLCKLYPDLKEHGDITDLCEISGDSDSTIKAVEAMAEKLPEYTRQEINEAITDGKEVFFENGAFRHNRMGDYLVQKYNVCRISGALHIYDDGVYRRGEETLYGRMIELYPQIKETQRKEVYKYLKSSLKVPEKKTEPPHLVPFATRIYNILTGEFLEYSPEYVFLNRFPYDYIPNAPEAPLVVDTIRKIADNDPEIEQLIYEAVGNCFYLANIFRGAVVLYGGGKNGKSTLLNLIIQVIGKDNASTLSMQNFSERFMVADIYGKAANIGDDIPSDYIRDTSNFKKAVTGEYIQAERKGQDPFSFIPYAKLFFSMNDLPPVKDKTAGFFSRIILVPLLHTFEQGKNADNFLKSRTWTQAEMECLVKKSIEGLKRLLKNGAFTVPKAAEKELAEYEIENNPVKEFLSERGDIKLPKPAEELYYEYDIWCSRSGHKRQLTRCRFSREICQLTGWKSYPVRHPHFAGKLVRCFVTDNV